MRNFFSLLFIVIIFVFLGALFFDVQKFVTDPTETKIATTTISQTPVTSIAKNTDIPKVSVTPPLVLKKVSTAEKPLARVSAVSLNNGAVKEYEVLNWTNYYRSKNGVAPLARNAKLDSAALVKANDMFARQYFEHVAPSGEDGADLITWAGYDYLMVGENLAEGNFSDAKDLVDAWMGSPGHRANILKAPFKEIGIAVMEGNYQGHNVLMAVQEFGRPASDCPLPADSEKAQIDADKMELDAMKSEADTLKTQMNTLANEQKYEEYNTLVPAYNDFVAKINALVQKISTEVYTYNAGIQTYKACAGTNNSKV
jgi:uncharacterized protein YkwD